MSKIRTVGGQLIDLYYPWANTHFDIQDIAHALGRIQRFNGHLKTDYSVADHSIFVARHWPDAATRREALMHDAHEAFVGDLPAPMKMLIPDYVTLERRVQTVLFHRFGMDLRTVLTPEFCTLDRRAALTEARAFRNPDEEWEGIVPFTCRIQAQVYPDISFLQAWEKGVELCPCTR